ncbi:hypothetical protein ACSBR2_022627 [Camellia fascicularis]
MDSSRVFFDPSYHTNMLFVGNGDPVFRGEISVMNMEETLKRRPFFSSSEKLYDEDYYDEQLPEKKRRLTPEQVNMLEKSFEAENKLEPEQKTQLAKKLGLQPRQVAVWFQNRRARWKTKLLERDFDHLKSSYESLLSDVDSICKENDKLKAEIVSLTEKLQTKEVAAGGAPKSEPLPADVVPHVSILQLNVKVEDRLSSGSGGSAVVEEEDGPQLVDSGDSYLPKDDIDRRNYFSPVFAAAGQQQHQPHDDGEPLGWWAWS